MASTRMVSPMRGVTYQLSRLSIRQDALPKSLSTSFARSITTSTSSQAAVSSITTSADGYVPVKPFAEQDVLATIHQFPSLEPLRLESFPANHLYLPTRRDILHRAVIYEGDKTRLGTASTKTRWEIRGSSRKIRPQKGTGRARLGDKRSPMLMSGGVSHGPKPRDFSTGLQKKVYDLAWRTALSYRFRKGELIIVDNAIEIESPSQRLLKHIFELHDRERGRGRSLLVTLENRPLLEQALDKMDRRRQALTWHEVDVKDLLELSRIIIERSALHNILFAHQEDLTHTTLPPWHKSFVSSSPPSNLEAVPGWSEFRTLMQTPPSEREAIRPDAYESVAYGRWTHAETLPEGDPSKLSLTISAYNLLAEAKDLRRQHLPSIPMLERDCTEKDVYQEGASDKANALTTLSAKEALVRWRETDFQRIELAAQAAENRRDALRWQGRHEHAEELEGEASDLRTDLADAKVQMFRAKKELAQAKAEVYILEDEIDKANEQQQIAQQMEDEENIALVEMSSPGQETDGEDAELLEQEEQAEMEKLRKEVSK